MRAVRKRPDRTPETGFITINAAHITRQMCRYRDADLTLRLNTRRRPRRTFGNEESYDRLFRALHDPSNHRTCTAQNLETCSPASLLFCWRKRPTCSDTAITSSSN